MLVEYFDPYIEREHANTRKHYAKLILFVPNEKFLINPVHGD